MKHGHPPHREFPYPRPHSTWVTESDPQRQERRSNWSRIPARFMGVRFVMDAKMRGRVASFPAVAGKKAGR